MRYRIRHRTSYDYSREVFESFNEVRLQPLACPTQTLIDFDLVIEPPATAQDPIQYPEFPATLPIGSRRPPAAPRVDLR